MAVVVWMGCFALMSSAFSQNYIFSGTVYDQDGSVLPYTEITSPCLGTPAVSDANGNFEVMVKSPRCTFVLVVPAPSIT